MGSAVRRQGLTVVFLMFFGGSGCREGPVEHGGHPVAASASGAVRGGRRGAVDRAAERRAMVEQSIRARGIRDPRVLEAMRRVPRHLFVPERVSRWAYADRALSIGEGQTISQPYVVAFLCEALRLSPAHRVLEIGTGSGYQAAVLANLVREVDTIEIVPELGRHAAERLAALGYGGVHVRIADGYRGWPEKAPFERIVLTAAPEHVPAPLLDQLAPGGYLVLPVGPAGRVQDLVRIHKREDGGIERESLLAVRFVPMTGEVDQAGQDGGG